MRLLLSEEDGYVFHTIKGLLGSTINLIHGIRRGELLLAKVTNLKNLNIEEKYPI
jgi:hypothetical protein